VLCVAKFQLPNDYFTWRTRGDGRFDSTDHVPRLTGQVPTHCRTGYRLNPAGKSVCGKATTKSQRKVLKSPTWRTTFFDLYIQWFPAIPFRCLELMEPNTAFTLRRGDTARSDLTIGLGSMKNFNAMRTGKFKAVRTRLDLFREAYRTSSLPD